MAIPFDTIEVAPAPVSLVGRHKFPDSGGRLVFKAEGNGLPLRHAGGADAVVYLDENGLVPAEIVGIDGIVIAGSKLDVDSKSLLPYFYGPVNARTLYARVEGGPVVVLIALIDEIVLLNAAVADAEFDANRAEAAATLANDTVAGTHAHSNTVLTNIAASAGGRNIIDPSTVLTGAAPDVAVILGGTTAFPHTVGPVGLPTIGGGYNNTITLGIASTIAGGAHHVSDAADGHTFIGGGSYHECHGAYGAVVGGTQNIIEGNYSTVAGGRQNKAGDVTARTTKTDQFVGAGQSNEAKGTQSVCVGGFNNQVNGAQAFTGAGSSNLVSGLASVVSGGAENVTGSTASYSEAGGKNAYARWYGVESRSGGAFAIAGDAQVTRAVLRRATTDAVQTELFLDGASLRLTMENDSTYLFVARVVGRNTAAEESAGYEIRGLVKRGVDAASTAMVVPVTMTVIGETVAGWDATASVGTGALTLLVTGEAAKTIKWAALLEMVQVTA